MLSRARAANVRTAIVTGTCVRTSEAAARLVDNQAANYPLFFTAGVHPHNAKVGACDTVLALGRVVGCKAGNACAGVAGASGGRLAVAARVARSCLVKQLVRAPSTWGRCCMRGSLPLIMLGRPGVWQHRQFKGLARSPSLPSNVTSPPWTGSDGCWRTPAAWRWARRGLTSTATLARRTCRWAWVRAVPRHLQAAAAP